MAVLAVGLFGAEFKISYLPFEERQRHTVRRVLREMEDHGWLTRDSKRAAIWLAGDRAALFLNVTAEKLDC